MPWTRGGGSRGDSGDSGGGGGFTFFADSRGVFCISFRILSKCLDDDRSRASCGVNDDDLEEDRR